MYLMLQQPRIEIRTVMAVGSSRYARTVDPRIRRKFQPRASPLYAHGNMEWKASIQAAGGFSREHAGQVGRIVLGGSRRHGLERKHGGDHDLSSEET